MKKLAFLLACFLLCGGWSHGRGPQTYIVSNSGNDSNNGLTPTTAWATPGKVNSSSFNSGDTVAFDSGSTFSAGLTLTQANAPSNLTITSTSAGQPTFNTGNSAACATITYVAWVTINNLNCVGAGTLTNTTTGISFVNTSTNSKVGGPKITNNTIAGYGKYCLDINDGDANSAWAVVTVSGNIIHDCTGNDVVSPRAEDECVFIGNTSAFGTSSTLTNVVVSSNTVFNCVGTATIASGSGKGIEIQGAKIVTVTGNVVHDFGANNTTSAGPVGIIFAGVDQGLISFNEVYNGTTGPGGGDGEGLDLDDGVTNSTVQYNYTHNNTSAEILLGTFGGNALNNITVRFNILEGNAVKADRGIYYFTSNHSTTNLAIYNNTIYVSTGSGMELGNGLGNTSNFSATIANNVIVNGGGSQMTINNGTNSAEVITGNDYSGSFSINLNGSSITSLAAFQTAGYEKVAGNPVGTTANPNLTSPGSGGTCGGWNGTCPTAYDLTAASPAGKGNGLNLNSLYSYNVGTVDFYGNAITNTTLPIGAAANK